jgi:hypothetical protein
MSETKKLNRQEMMSIVLVKWHTAVMDAESFYQDQDLEQLDRVRKIKQHAQKTVVNALQAYKGVELTWDETCVAQEMFDDLSSHSEYFSILTLYEAYEKSFVAEGQTAQA